MAHLRMLLLERQCAARGGSQSGMDNQHVKWLSRDIRQDQHFIEGLQRDDPVIAQLVEHFFDVQPLQVPFIGNQDGQCFGWHRKSLSRHRSRKEGAAYFSRHISTKKSA